MTTDTARLPHREADLLQAPECRLTEWLIAHHRTNGDWSDGLLGDYLTNVADDGALSAVSVDARTGAVTNRLTYGELRSCADRLAGGLRERGIGFGDGISVMLPNRLEYGIAAQAVLRSGAIYSGIPVSYGRRECTFMMRRARTRALIVCDRHRNRDYVEFIRELRGELPELELVVVVGQAPDEPGWASFDELIDSGSPIGPLALESTALAHIGFTSGTTGEPKGVMNTHAALDVVLRRWAEHLGPEVFAPGFVNLLPSPVGHHTGFMWGVLLTTYAAGTAVYLDSWNPATAVQAMGEHRVTTYVASPTFLQDLLENPEFTAERLPDLRMISIPGAPAPRRLLPTARQRLDCAIVPAWGMTEYAIAMSGSPNLPVDRVEATDGVPVRGASLRVVDEQGAVVEPGTEGELQMSGAGLFVGYLGRPDFTDESFDGPWFRTGDRAIVDPDGWMSITGRTKDIVIRGGENIPVADIENVAHAHPDVRDIAVVGIPDERLGERAVACVVTAASARLSLDALNSFLLDSGLSKHFLPEFIEVMDELPKTMSGKVRKDVLRAHVREMQSREAPRPPVVAAETS